MIVLGVVLMLIGFLAGIPVLWTIGIILGPCWPNSLDRSRLWPQLGSSLVLTQRCQLRGQNKYLHGKVKSSATPAGSFSFRGQALAARADLAPATRETTFLWSEPAAAP